MEQECYQVSWCAYDQVARRRGQFTVPAPDADTAALVARIAVRREYPHLPDSRIAIGDVIPVGAAA